MPMFTTLRIALAGVAGPVAAADAVGERRHPVEHGVHVGHHVLAVDLDRGARGARSAMCRTARFSVTLIFSPRNIASMRSRRPRLLGEREQQLDRLVGDPVLRVVEEQAGALGRQQYVAMAMFLLVARLQSRIAIPDYTQLSADEVRAMMRAAYLDPEFIEAGIQSAGAWDNAKGALGMTGEEMRAEADEIRKWDEVETGVDGPAERNRRRESEAQASPRLDRTENLQHPPPYRRLPEQTSSAVLRRDEAGLAFGNGEKAGEGSRQRAR